MTGKKYERPIREQHAPPAQQLAPESKSEHGIERMTEKKLLRLP
jgi:hypothetical protein